MQIGMTGLGRMGSNRVRRLLQEGHECVAHNRSAEAVEALRWCHGQALYCAWPSLRTAAKADSRLRLEAEAIGLWIYVHLMRKQP